MYTLKFAKTVNLMLSVLHKKYSKQEDGRKPLETMGKFMASITKMVITGVYYLSPNLHVMSSFLYVK